jgi:hypothetical protein
MHLFIVKLLVVILSTINLESMASQKGEEKRLTMEVVNASVLANRETIRESYATRQKLEVAIKK